MINNQKLTIINKWIADVLGEKGIDHINILERLSTVMITNKDLEEFSKLMSDVYGKGYQKAINDNKAQLEKLGYSVELKTRVEV